MRKAVMALLLISLSVCAKQYTVEGKVDFVRSHNPEIVGQDNDWIALEGVSSVGYCREWGGHVVFLLSRDMDRAYSTALSAQMSGKTLVVNVDDNLKDSSGACWVRWVNAKN